MGIRVERGPRPSVTRSFNDVIADIERTAAENATDLVSEEWPTKTGESLPHQRENAMVFDSPAAPFIRRAGDSEPLLDDLVPTLAAEAADDTFTQFKNELTNAALKGT